MPAKFTFFYNIGPLQGVSESYFTAAVPTLPQMIFNIQTYLTARMGMSGLDTTFTYCRVSTLTPPLSNRRRVQIFYPVDIQTLPRAIVPTTGQFTFGAADEGSNDPWSALLTRRQNGPQFSLQYLRGFPDALSINGGTIWPAAGAAWNNALNAYFAAVVQLSFGWISQVATVNSPAPLLTATQNADGTATLGFGPSITTGNQLFSTVIPPPMGSLHTQVRVSQQVLPRGFNGTYTVNVLGPSSARTLRPLNVSTFLAGNGQGWIYTPTFTQILTMRQEKMVSRRSGAPFGRSRGRRANRANG
jgi:hypothetical protein